MKKFPELFLICTGLGRINRGFETHINDLATKLSNEKLSFNFYVYLGKKIKERKYKQQPVLHIPRNSRILRYCSLNSAFEVEQITFFIGIIPYLLFRRPKAIYLGEYNLYCYLYKFRQLFNLNYSLILYTGGQAIPGLFNKSKDFVHHITDVYYDLLVNQGVPKNRQFIIPHFINFPLKADTSIVQKILQKAAGKKILLSVGQIDMTIKRMHLIPQLFAEYSNMFYPILIGNETPQSKQIRNSMDSTFGENGYSIIKLNREEIGNYYSAADIFVLCSEKESFGMVFLEALLFDLPIICYDFPESKYVLRDKAIFLDINNTVKSKKIISENILFINKFKNNDGNLFVEKNYSWTALSNNYISMFEQILN